jgi:hypothetical protein
VGIVFSSSHVEENAEKLALEVVRKVSKHGVPKQKESLRQEVVPLAASGGYFVSSESTSDTCTSPSTTLGYVTNQCITVRKTSFYYTCSGSSSANIKYYNNTNCNAADTLIDTDVLLSACFSSDNLYNQYSCTTDGSMVLPASDNFIKK